MLDEKGTAAALREAYKNGGYRVAFAEGRVLIRAGVWGVEIEAEYICQKILGTVVEHIGILPDDSTAYLAHKDADPGTTCSLDEELAAWAEIRRNAEAAKTHIKRTQLTLNGYEIWQTGEGLKVRPMAQRFTRIIEATAVKQAFIQKIGDELGQAIYFKGFVELAVIYGVEQKGDNLTRIEGFPWLGEGS